MGPLLLLFALFSILIHNLSASPVNLGHGSIHLRSDCILPVLACLTVSLLVS